MTLPSSTLLAATLLANAASVPGPHLGPDRSALQTEALPLGGVLNAEAIACPEVPVVDEDDLAGAGAIEIDLGGLRGRFLVDPADLTRAARDGCDDPGFSLFAWEEGGDGSLFLVFELSGDEPVLQTLAVDWPNGGYELSTLEGGRWLGTDQLVIDLVSIDGSSLSGGFAGTLEGYGDREGERMPVIGDIEVETAFVWSGASWESATD